MRPCRFPMVFAVALLFVFAAPSPIGAVSLDRLTPEEADLRESVMKRLNPLIEAHKKAGTAPILDFGDLYEPLTAGQVAFLESFRAIDPAKLGGSSRRLPDPPAEVRFVRIDGQVVLRDGKAVPLDTQYLPLEAYDAYRRMMAALEEDLGRHLLVESGYRSPAYQLYLFLFYMPKHGGSVRETSRFVALPGYSEHGCPLVQAIDFVTPEGVNGEDHPEEFEELQEYGWLQARAHEFGFYLSYPRPSASSGQAASAFEPWHWHWEAGDPPEAE